MLPDGCCVSSLVVVSCVDAAVGLTGAPPSVDVATGVVRAEGVDVLPTSAFFAVGGVVALVVRFLGICARQEDFLQHRIMARLAKDDATKNYS